MNERQGKRVDAVSFVAETAACMRWSTHDYEIIAGWVPACP
jgi:hypothetical protein